MRLVYIHHSCFLIEADGFSVLIDYFRDTGKELHQGYVNDKVLDSPGSLYVLASHRHADHYSARVLSWKDRKENITYLLSKDIEAQNVSNNYAPLYLAEGDTFSDGNLTVKAYGSTDEGISFLITLQGRTFFHAGDLNNWHWSEESTPQEAQEAEQYYLNTLGRIAREVSHVDVLMFPLDARLGSDFMRGARQFIQQIAVDLVVPMHFWDNPDEANRFAHEAREQNCRFELLTERGQSLEL